MTPGSVKWALLNAKDQASRGRKDSALRWLRDAKNRAILSGEEIRLSPEEMADLVDTVDALIGNPPLD